MMEVLIDEELCIACGNCAEVCPAVFHLNEEVGIAEVIDAEACEFVGCCEAAAENCPEGAIKLME
jgi:ferredoxin